MVSSNPQQEFDATQVSAAFQQPQAYTERPQSVIGELERWSEFSRPGCSQGST